MEDRVTTMRNFKRIKIFDFLHSISDADVRGELLEKFARFNGFNVNVTVDKNNQRAAYVKFLEHDEACRCFDFIGEFLTIGNAPATAVPVLSKTTNATNSNVSNYKTDNVSLRGRGSVSSYRANVPSRGTAIPSFRGGGRGWAGRGGFPTSMNERRPPPSFRKVRPASQNLFVGNLNKSTSEDELRRVFKRFGIIEDVDIKTSYKGTFAFIKYLNMDMAVRAHREMEHAEIGGAFITVGFGESTPSRCLWIGGIGPWTDGEEVGEEFQRFGKIERFSWPQGKNFAYVLYEDVKMAMNAYRELKGLELGRDRQRIRLDYVRVDAIDSPFNYKDFEFEETAHEEQDRHFDSENPGGNSRASRDGNFSQSLSPHGRARSKGHWRDQDWNENEKRSSNSRQFSPPMNVGSQTRGNGRLNPKIGSPNSRHSSAWTNRDSQPCGKGPLSPSSKNDDNYKPPRVTDHRLTEDPRIRGRGRGSFERGKNSFHRGGFGGNNWNWERGGAGLRRTNGSLRRPGGSRGSVGRAGRIDNFGNGRSAEQDGRDSDRHHSSEGRRDESWDGDYERKGDFHADGRSRGSFHRDDNTRASHRKGPSSERDQKQRSRSKDRYSGDRHQNSHRRHRDAERRRSRSDSFDRRSSTSVERKRRKVRGSQRRSSSFDRISSSGDRRSRSYDRKSFARTSEKRNRNRSRSVDAGKDKNQSLVGSPTKKLSPAKAVAEPNSIGPQECRPLSDDVIVIDDNVASKPLAFNHERFDSLPVRYSLTNEQLTLASVRAPVTSVVTAPAHPLQSVATTLTSSQNSLPCATTETPLGVTTTHAASNLGAPANNNNHVNRQAVISAPASHQRPLASSTLIGGSVCGTEGVNAEIARRFPVVWSGAMVLKNSAFVTNMYLVSGSVPLVDSLLRDPASPDCPVLKISQRLRLDDPLKLNELERRIASSGRNGCSVLLAAPAAAQVGDVNNVIQQRALSSLGVYLHEKECAAVIFLPPGGSGFDTGVLHAFPPSRFATEFLRKEAPDLVPNYPKDDHLLVIVMRDLTL